MEAKKRESGIELFRILTMLAIVAHHYIVNSGLYSLVLESRTFSFQNIFLLIFGWGGKTGINCFVLITGYFMCTSKITLKKFLKLVLEVEFYKIAIYIIFLLTGYKNFSVKSLIDTLLPVTSVSTGFTSAYIVFFLFIPFLNILLNGMNKKQHIYLLLMCIGVYTVLPTLGITVTYNYALWFSIIYFIGAYLRLYPETWFNSKRIWGALAIASVLISWASVVLLPAIAKLLGIGQGAFNYVYYLVADSNKPLAILTAVSTFMYFKNCGIKYSRIINTVSASAFGVLLIHANSSTMINWLWKDTLKNTAFYNSNMIYLHAITSVVGIYIVCTIIDILRIKCLEKPLFKQYDKLYNLFSERRKV
ncbi:MAG: acyltransferase family protein [Clostridia bacterium]|nr:acyltransferase family protein [Clostridia bacterium]